MEEKKRGRPRKEEIEKVETIEKTPEELQAEMKKTMEHANIRTEWPDVSVLKDWGRTDPLKLTAEDPQWAYRWLRDKSDNINFKTSNDPTMGYWKIVPSEHLDELEKKFGVKILRAGDGLCRRGDLILAYMPKKFWMGKVKIKEERARAARAAIDEMQKDGIPGKGIQTEKQLGMEGKNFRK